MELLEGVRDVGDYPGSRKDGQSGRQGSSPDRSLQWVWGRGVAAAAHAVVRGFIIFDVFEYKSI